MVTTVLLALFSCSQGATDGTVSTSASDTSVVEDEPLCTQDQFCDEMLGCFSFMGLDTCESYYDDGMGSCDDLSPADIEEYQACICGCWVNDDERTCLGMGTCSDWCVQAVCGWIQ